MARPRRIIKDAVLEGDSFDGGLASAIAKSKNVKLRDEAQYPPKIRDFKGKDFSNQDMADMFESLAIKHGDFTDANLSGADFSFFNLQGCIFTGANLQDTNFTGADLRWSNFKSADYRKAIFETDNEAANLGEVDGISI